MVFKTDPGDEGSAKGEVEKSFVGEGENDEGWRKGEEDDDEAMEVVIVRVETVEKWYY